MEQVSYYDLSPAQKEEAKRWIVNNLDIWGTVEDLEDDLETDIFDIDKDFEFAIENEKVLISMN